MDLSVMGPDIAFSRQLPALLPYLVLAGGGLLVMLVDAFVKSRRKDHLYMLTLLILLGTVVTIFIDFGGGHTPNSLLWGMLAYEPYTRFFMLLFVAIAMLSATFATSAFDLAGRFRGEFYPLILFATLGMAVLGAATDLLSLYLGLETMSMAVYVLAGGSRGSARSSEAGFKYLILGAFSSAFLLFGMGLLYGQTGTTSFAGIGEALGAADGGGALLSLGVGLMLIGFGFKVSMVPFHMWTPDVYDGAPAYVTGLMATGVKAAGFAALARFVWLLLPLIADVWFPLLAVLAVLTMTVGNLVALSQTSIKRMLAWSSIAHAGYLLLGVLVLLQTARSIGVATRMVPVATAAGGGLLFYLVGYAVMNLGAFGIVNFLGRGPGREADRIDGYAGLSRRQPVAAAAMAVFMFSLAGIPPTVGFVGKFYIFDAVVKAGMVPLAVWGVVNSLLSVYYYLRVVVVMYMHPAGDEAYDGRSWESSFAVGVLALIVLFLGVYPGTLFKMAAITFRYFAF